MSLWPGATCKQTIWQVQLICTTNTQCINQLNKFDWLINKLKAKCTINTSHGRRNRGVQGVHVPPTFSGRGVHYYWTWLRKIKQKEEWLACVTANQTVMCTLWNVLDYYWWLMCNLWNRDAVCWGLFCWQFLTVPLLTSHILVRCAHRITPRVVLSSRTIKTTSYHKHTITITITITIVRL